MEYVNADLKRKAKENLEESSLSHEELSNALGIGWDETQSVIRELRNEGEVRLNLDREYELNQ